MRRVAVLSLSAALLLGACSSDDPTLDESPTPTDTETPTEVETTEAETDEPTPDDTGTPTTDDETEAGLPPGTEADLVLVAELDGGSEVPGPGDPAGTGSFTGGIVMNEAAGELCYVLEVADLSSEVTAAHIHRGPEGEAGDIHVELTPPIGGPVDECITLNATELVPLMDDPSQFYVNVHSQGHPDGAVRGQLEEE
jgi:hypothetical protein